MEDENQTQLLKYNLVKNGKFRWMTSTGEVALVRDHSSIQYSNTMLPRNHGGNIYVEHFYGIIKTFILLLTWQVVAMYELTKKKRNLRVQT